MECVPFLVGVYMLTSPDALVPLDKPALLSLFFTGVSPDPRGLALLDETTKLFLPFVGVPTFEVFVTRLPRRRGGVPYIGVASDDFLGVVDACTVTGFWKAFIG